MKDKIVVIETNNVHRRNTRSEIIIIITNATSAIHDNDDTQTQNSHVTQKLGKKNRNPAPISFRYCALI